MTIAERGKSRAQGALDNFLADMAKEMENRPPEYIAAFWKTLRHNMREYVKEAD